MTSIVSLLGKVSASLPAVGLFGLAVYQAAYQKDITSAAHSAGQGLTLLGIAGLGGSLLALQAKTEALRVGHPGSR